MNKSKDMTLLQSLLEIFSSSESLIRYVVEKKHNEKITYERPSKNVVEWWKLLYCKSIVALSVAPQSQDQQLSKDALSAFVRKVINDKNKSIVEKRLNPRLMSSKCGELISEEIEHLEQTIQLGVRAAHSPYDTYTLKIQEASLKHYDDVKIFIDEAIEFLEQLFFGVPLEIITKEHMWFAKTISEPLRDRASRYTKEQILSMIACSLVLALNVSELPEINSNIEEFLRSVFSREEKIPASVQDTDTAEPEAEIYKGGNNSDFSRLEEDREVLRKSTFLISRATGKNQDELVEEIEALIQSWRTSMLDVWKTFSVKQKIQHIREDYFELLVEYDSSYSKTTKT